MANLVVRDYDDPTNIHRALINQGMNPDVANLKKRKFTDGSVKELNLPAPKHKCYEVSNSISSEQGSTLTNALESEDVYTQNNEGQDDMVVWDMGSQSDQDSNSFHGDSQLSAGVNFNVGSRNSDSYEEASTSWSNSGSGISRLESRTEVSAGDDKEVIMFPNGEDYPRQDTGWHDNDFLEECISSEHSKDIKQLTADGLQEFLSSSGMDPNISALSSERWNVDQGVQLERRKPTIDQEFEQYFSMLML